ncbi:class I SAM-dependent methyltransferase [Pseudomonadota bacterium]
MDTNDKALVQERYQIRLKEYGAGIKALASGTEERRSIRFDVLSGIGIQDGDSVLDVGCGLADYFIHLKESGVNVQYTGIDIVPDLVSLANNTHPELDVTVRDLQESPYPEDSFDYVVCSQVFNFNFGGDKNMSLVRDMLPLMFKAARRGLAVDFITDYVDFKQDHLFYYSPEELFKFSKQLTRRVTLRHDYPLFEFCLYLYPSFSGWSE